MSKKGPTPICPECGSCAVSRVDDECTCKRCKHVGTVQSFIKHIGGSSYDPDLIQPSYGERHQPRLTDEWSPDDQ